MKIISGIRRTLIGALLIAVAVFISYCLNDYLDRRNPDYAVPQLIVTADGQELDVYLSSYYWRFAFGREAEKREPEIDGGAVSILDEGVVQINTLHGGEELRYEFSQTELSRLIDRSEAYSTYRFDLADEEAYVMHEPGAYYYKVTADFVRGRVTYYFRIDVIG